MGGEDEPRGRDLAIDADAASTADALPGFLARPEGAPVYHGFSVVGDVTVDGFGLGLITTMSDDDYGDAFVIAPDGTRAGLVWEVGDARIVAEVLPPDEDAGVCGLSRFRGRWPPSTRPARTWPLSCRSFGRSGRRGGQRARRSVGREVSRRAGARERTSASCGHA